MNNYKLEFDVNYYSYELFLEVKVPMATMDATAKFVVAKLDEFREKLPPVGRRYYGPTRIKYDKREG